MPYGRKRLHVVTYLLVALLLISGTMMLPALADALPPATYNFGNMVLAIVAAVPFGFALKALTSRR